LQGEAEQVTASVEGESFAGVQDVAIRGGLGKRVHLGDEGNGALDGDTLRLATILESQTRHGIASRMSQANCLPHSRFPCLLPEAHPTQIDLEVREVKC